MNSPRSRARLAGFFYLLTFVTAGVALYCCGSLLVAGDAAATAANIVAHEARFRLGFAAFVLNVAVYLAVTALFYELFEPVNRTVSRIAALFSLVGCAVQAVACVFLIAPLALLGDPKFASVFGMAQVRAISLMSLKLHTQAFNIGIVFFGFYCAMIGYLIHRSTFLPRIIGVLMMLAGASWLTFLAPPFAHQLQPYNLFPGLVGEGSLMLWLTVMGVNAERWREQARIA